MTPLPESFGEPFGQVQPSEGGLVHPARVVGVVAGAQRAAPNLAQVVEDFVLATDNHAGEGRRVHVQTCFFAQFTDHGVTVCFASLDTAAW